MISKGDELKEQGRMKDTIAQYTTTVNLWLVRVCTCMYVHLYNIHDIEIIDMCSTSMDGVCVCVCVCWNVCLASSPCVYTSIVGF